MKRGLFVGLALSFVVCVAGCNNSNNDVANNPNAGGPAPAAAVPNACIERVQAEDFGRLPMPGAAGYATYQAIEPGYYEAKQVAVMFRLRNGPFLFSQGISMNEWMAAGQQGAIAQFQSGDFPTYYSTNSWNQMDITRYRHAIGTQIALPLILQRSATDLNFQNYANYAVQFRGGPQSFVQTRVGYPYTGPSIFQRNAFDQGVGPLLIAPNNYRQTPIVHVVEKRNGYFKLTLRYRQARVHAYGACTNNGCAVLRTCDDVADVYVQVIYVPVQGGVGPGPGGPGPGPGGPGPGPGGPGPGPGGPGIDPNNTGAPGSGPGPDGDPNGGNSPGGFPAR